MNRIYKIYFKKLNTKTIVSLLAFFLFLVFSALGFNSKESKNLANGAVGMVESVADVNVDENLNGDYAVVKRVIDGDTIELKNGQKVRYIGIDAPESVDPRRPVECFGKESSNKNKELVDGKRIRLEKDVSEVDRYGRLLRYVWVGDRLINELLVREGYASSISYPPDVKYQQKFSEAEKLAREESLGLWGENCL